MDRSRGRPSLISRFYVASHHQFGWGAGSPVQEKEPRAAEGALGTVGAGEALKLLVPLPQQIFSETLKRTRQLLLGLPYCALADLRLYPPKQRAPTPGTDRFFLGSGCPGQAHACPGRGFTFVQ